MSGEPRLRLSSRIEALGGYFSPQIDVDVRLNTNEAPEPPPPGFLEAVRVEIDKVALNRYPDRQATALREAIADLHGVRSEEVYAANGSNEVLQSLLLAFGGPGRSSLVFEPTYALHSHISHITGTTVLAGEREGDYLVNVSEIARMIDVAARAEEDLAVLFLCSPNNPTGRIESAESIAAALGAAPGLVVVDEAYGQFAPRSSLELRADNPHLVVVRTFSKTWSLAALRLGYAIADPDVVDAMFAVTLPYHLDALKQAAGRVALQFAPEMEDRTRRLVAERERLLVQLRAMPLEVCPSDANFVLFRPVARDAKDVWEALVARSVLVRDVSSYERLAGFLRVTVGTAAEDDEFLEALGSALA